MTKSVNKVRLYKKTHMLNIEIAQALANLIKSNIRSTTRGLRALI